MATHSSILAQEIPWTEELGERQSMGSQKELGMTQGLSNNNLSSVSWHSLISTKSSLQYILSWGYLSTSNSWVHLVHQDSDGSQDRVIPRCTPQLGFHHRHESTPSIIETHPPTIMLDIQRTILIVNLAVKKKVRYQ